MAFVITGRALLWIISRKNSAAICKRTNEKNTKVALFRADDRNANGFGKTFLKSMSHIPEIFRRIVWNRIKSLTWKLGFHMIGSLNAFENKSFIFFQINQFKINQSTQISSRLEPISINTSHEIAPCFNQHPFYSVTLIDQLKTKQLNKEIEFIDNCSPEQNFSNNLINVCLSFDKRQ